MSGETVKSTKGIFSFDEHTYVWSWFIVGGEDKDFLACLYRKKPGADIAFTYRFRYYESDDPFDKRDVKHVYEAFWKPDHDIEKVLVTVRKLAASVAEEYGSTCDELVVNGGVDSAAEILMRHQAVHVETNGPGGEA